MNLNDQVKKEFVKFNIEGQMAKKIVRIPKHKINIVLAEVPGEPGRMGGLINAPLSMKVPANERRRRAALEGVESLILAQACAGIDVTTEQYSEALQTAIDAIDHNYE